jgi:hypothetical protein
MSCTNKLNEEYYNDPSELLKKITKYLVEGIVVALVVRWIPSKNLSLKEIAIISLSATATLVILDLYSPTISYGYRNGIGLALGAKSVLSPL